MAHNTRLRTFHLFAGAGGGILADLLLGHLPVGACEIKPYPRNVLLARQRDGILPEFPIWDDVCTLDGKPWHRSVDVLCGGFPCQDISLAGKGTGITGARSGLWKEYARLIDEMRPRFVFAENSPLLRTRGLGVVLEDLAALGYDARWGVLGAWHVGAPHKRNRIWILAYPNSTGREELDFPAVATRSRQHCGVYHARECSNSDRNGCTAGSRDAGGKIGAEHHGRDAERFLPGSWWAAESAPSSVAYEVANRLDQLRASGNGQYPEVAALAFSILSEGLIKTTENHE